MPGGTGWVAETMKEEIIFDGNRYLSSKEAAKGTGYTNDYVARLCRVGEVKGRMIGRTWYVEEKSLRNFVDSAKKKKIQHNKKLSLSRRGEYKSSSVVFKDKKNKKNLKISLFKSNAAENLDKSDFYQKSVALLIALVVVFGGYEFRNISLNELVNSSTTFFTYEGSKKAAKELHNNVDSFFVKVVKATDKQKITAAVEEVKLPYVAETIVFLKKLAFKTYNSLSVLVGAARKVEIQNEILINDKAREGLVVLPGNENEESNAEAIEKIKDSFSDEVNVFPDESGKSGIIKPVFKNKQEEEYLYVLVPVED